MTPVSAFRPLLNRLEDRENPVSPADVFFALGQTAVTAAVLDTTEGQIQLLENQTTQATNRETLTTLREASARSAGVLGEFANSLLADVRANPALAPALIPLVGAVSEAQVRAVQNSFASQAFVNYIDFTAARQTALTGGASGTDLGTDNGLGNLFGNVSGTGNTAASSGFDLSSLAGFTSPAGGDTIDTSGNASTSTSPTPDGSATT